jgi:hypothetical protein
LTWLPKSGYKEIHFDGDSIEVNGAVRANRAKFVSQGTWLCIGVGVKSLWRHRARQNEERLRLGAAWDDSFDLVLPNGIGRSIQLHIIGQTQFH